MGVDELSQVLFQVVSVCGVRAQRTVNRVAPRASTPYPKAICGSEKVFESSPEMRLGKVGAAVAEEVDRAEYRCPVG